MLNEEAQKAIDKANRLSSEFDEMVKKMDRVLFYLEDDAATGQKGFVSRLSALEERLSNMETLDKINKGKKSVWLFIGSGATAILLNADKLITAFNKLFD